MVNAPRQAPGHARGRRMAAPPRGSTLRKVQRTAALGITGIAVLTAAALPLPQTESGRPATDVAGTGTAAGRVGASTEEELDFGRPGLSSRAAEEPAGGPSAASYGVPPSGSPEQPGDSGSRPRGAVPAPGLTAPLAQMSVSSPFGYRMNPMTGAAGDFHNGTDLSSGCGTPVLAAGSGVVAEVSSSAWGYGNRIVLDHGGGMKTTYNHLGSMGLQSGQTVSAGERIAGVGTTGNSTGCHLHFEVVVGGETVDSAGWL